MVHPTAIVHPNAKIGNDVKIGPYCMIGENVVLGDGCELVSNVVIDGHTTIGKNNRFFHSAVIGTEPQDLKFKQSDPTRLIIGDNNTFREFTTINKSATLEEPVTIDNGCLLMAYVHVAHNCHIGSNVIIANAVNLAGHITIQDFVTVGGMTAVHQFVQIGAYAFVGGKSGVKMDVPPYTRGEDMPYRLSGLNTVGLQRKGFTTEQINAIKDVYDLFFRTGLNRGDALEKALEIENPTPEQKLFIEFAQNSNRGLCRARH